MISYYIIGNNLMRDEGQGKYSYIVDGQWKEEGRLVSYMTGSDAQYVTRAQAQDFVRSKLKLDSNKLIP